MGDGMRLIDADMIIKNIHERSYINKALSEILETIIDEQPTAYDVGRVVEQLEELPICSTWNHNSDNISRNKAIEIVKEGGKNDK